MWDLQIYKPEIIQLTSWEQKNPQEVLNSAVEQQRQTIIEWMKKDILKDWISPKRVEELQYDVIWNIWVIVSRGKLAYLYKYSKDNWVEFYTTFPDLQKSRFLQFALRETWLDLKDWKLYRWEKEIPQFLQNWGVNPEFVRWIDHINFYDEIQNSFWLMKSVMKWNKIEFSYNWMYASILSWVMRIKDVMYFAWKKDFVSVDEKWTKFTDEEIKKLLTRAIQELPNQCSDTRFVKNARWVEMWMEVTKSELDEYLHPTQWLPLITQAMYDDCLRRIEIRDRKIQQERDIKQQSQSERKIETQTKSFSDRVLDILKWVF